MSEEEIDLDLVQARLDKARAELSALCKGKRFVMSIPAQPDYDSDLIIGAALRDLARLIKEVEELWEKNYWREVDGLDE